MSNFLDCAKDLEQCRQQQSAADQLQQRMDATMDQQAMWSANQNQQPGGRTGVPVKVLGYNNELGGYLVEERNGNISLMRSRSNAGLPTGAIIPAECEELVVPPAWVLSYLQQYPRTKKTGGYWFVYSIEYFDNSEELVKTAFYIGGAGNVFVKEYAANTNTALINFGELSISDTDVDPDGTGSASISLSGNSVSFQVDISCPAGNEGSAFGVELFSEQPILARIRSAYTISLSASSSVSGSRTSSDPESFRSSADAFANFGSLGSQSVNMEGSGTSGNPPEINNTATLDRFNLSLSARCSYSATTSISGSSTLSMTTTMEGVASKQTDAEVVYLARTDNILYLAIRYHPENPELSATSDNYRIDYFTIIDGQITETQTFSSDAEISTGASINDWRRSLLELDELNDGDSTFFNNPDSGDVCIEAYKFNSFANLDGDQLRVVTGDITGALLSTVEVVIQESAVTRNGSDCSSGNPQNINRRAAQVAAPILAGAATSSTTTILWAAP